MPGVVHAGRPLSTDDATILGPKDCQLETWVDRSRVATGLLAAPACNFGGNFEWQVGASRTHAEGSGALSQTYVQGKTAFVSVDDNPWGVGLTAGVQRFPLRETESGWKQSLRARAREFPAWNRGSPAPPERGLVRNSERSATPPSGESPSRRRFPAIPFTVVGEVFGENASRPFYRLGGRWTQVARNLDVDLTYVARVPGERSRRKSCLGLYYKFDQAIP
jgi:hypothetical protein